jgi:hypothetical protein
MLMERKWFFTSIFGSISVLGAGLLASYMLFAISVGRPLSLSESLFFSSALLRALPSPLSTGENRRSTVEFVRQAVVPGSKSTYRSVVAGRRYEVPLPPHTVRHPDHDRLRHRALRDRIPHCPDCDWLYITFATPEQLTAYYRITLPEAGWDYVDRMGDGHRFRKNTTQLLIIDHHNYYHGTKISDLAVSIYELKTTKQ